MKRRRSTEEAREITKRVRASLKALEGHISQAALERLLRMSSAYLSRLRRGASTPSGSLVSLLALIAASPSQVLPFLQDYWANPLPSDSQAAGTEPGPDAPSA